MWGRRSRTLGLRAQRDLQEVPTGLRVYDFNLLEPCATKRSLHYGAL